MRHPLILPAAAALIALSSPAARAESPWSASVHGGLVMSSLETAPAAWADVLHAVTSSVFMGVEAGYIGLPGEDLSFGGPTVVGYRGPTGVDRALLTASAVARVRGPGPPRAYVHGGVGYYDLATRTNYTGGPPDRIAHQGYPGINLAIGLSAAGIFGPAFQVRWDHAFDPEREDRSTLSVAAGLHFN